MNNGCAYVAPASDAHSVLNIFWIKKKRNVYAFWWANASLLVLHFSKLFSAYIPWKLYSCVNDGNIRLTGGSWENLCEIIYRLIIVDLGSDAMHAIRWWILYELLSLSVIYFLSSVVNHLGSFIRLEKFTISANSIFSSHFCLIVCLHVSIPNTHLGNHNSIKAVFQSWSFQFQSKFLV